MGSTLLKGLFRQKVEFFPSVIWANLTTGPFLFICLKTASVDFSFKLASG